MNWVSSPVFLLLLFTLQAVAVMKANSENNLVRRKRLTIPPKHLIENKDYTGDPFIAKIHSEFDNGKGNIYYSLEGIGADQPPYYVFVVDPRTGYVRVTKVLDREEIDTYRFKWVAKFENGSLAEEGYHFRVKVVDENDNPPVFGVIQPGEVEERCPAGTSVMKITATDADEQDWNLNSMIAYTIIEQNPPHDMFNITKDGTISVKNSGLDRERADQYNLTVRGQDLYGDPKGNSATGIVTINVLDVNDNSPTLEKEGYEGNIEENTVNVEVMRIKAQDLDLKYTDNWEAVFDIVRGNEAGYFSIKTDPKTNEGILMLDKAMDYEDVKYLQLAITVRNKAPMIDGSGRTSRVKRRSGTPFKTYPIKINVKNKPERPSFDPKVKAFTISEEANSIDINKVIDRYPAIDEDTGKPAENVRYVKGSDPDEWLSIHPETAEIKLNKIPDRESLFLVNGTYIATVLCISEGIPPGTATGTIAIEVEDVNDHCPTLTRELQTMCTTADAVILNAVDNDVFPNGPPFEFFIIPEGTEGKWWLEHFNNTAVILRSEDGPLSPGSYKVELVIMDQQGGVCPETQKVTVQVCPCVGGRCVGHDVPLV